MPKSGSLLLQEDTIWPFLDLSRSLVFGVVGGIENLSSLVRTLAPPFGAWRMSRAGGDYADVPVNENFFGNTIMVLLLILCNLGRTVVYPGSPPQMGLWGFWGDSGGNCGGQWRPGNQWGVCPSHCCKWCHWLWEDMLSLRGCAAAASLPAVASWLSSGFSV